VRVIVLLEEGLGITSLLGVSDQYECHVKPDNIPVGDNDTTTVELE
jgi:hypothetical protein